MLPIEVPAALRVGEFLQEQRIRKTKWCQWMVPKMPGIENSGSGRGRLLRSNISTEDYIDCVWVK